MNSHNEFSPESILDQICVQFEAAWKANENPKISDWIDRVPKELRQDLVDKLIPLEIRYHLQNEQEVTPEDYRGLGDEAVVVAEQFLIAHDSGQLAIQQVPADVEQTEITYASDQINLEQVRSDAEQSGITNKESESKSSQTIGPYKLLQQIGEGGMGAVWMADQEKPIKRRVALKLIKPELANEEFIARFEAERQALSMMNHPNIARVLDAGTSELGEPYFVMELLQGIPLNKYCDDNKLSIKERLELFVPVCKAIQHAHQKGILHRDLKPSNVLVTLYDGKPVAKVIDFGLAKAIDHTHQLTDKTMFTEFGKVVGTLQYMSPEQAGMDAMDVDTRTDIYSLGVMLYQLLTGSTPLDRQTLGQNALLQVLQIIRETEPPRPSDRLSSSGDVVTSISEQRQIIPARLQQILRGELDWIVMKALEKDRTRRYETASGFADDIERYLNHDPVLARPPSSSYRIGKFVRKNKGLVAAAAAIALLLVSGIAGTSYGLVQANRKTAEAESQRREAEKQKQVAISEKERADTEAKAARAAQQQASISAEQSERDKKLAEQAAKQAEQSAKRSNDALKIFTDSFRSIDPAKQGADANMLAKDVLFRAKDSLENSELDNEGKANLLNALTISFLGVGEYTAATSTSRSEFAILKEKLGPDHPNTLRSMSNLAMSYGQAGHTDKALELDQQVLELWKAKLGPDHPDILITMNNLATSYRQAGHTNKALELDQQVLELQKTKLGPDHPDTLISMNNLAMSYGQAGLTDKALELDRQVLELWKAKLGSDHPNTLTSMNNLSVNYLQAGQTDKAVELFQQVLKLRKAKLGPEHPDTMTSMNNLAVSYYEAGDTDKALELDQQVFELRKAKLGPDHPDTLNSSANLGGALSHNGDFVASEVILQECFQNRNKNSPDAWTSFSAQSLLGAAQMGLEKFELAKPNLVEGYQGLKARVASNSNKNLLKALDRLIELAKVTDHKEDLKKWTAEKEKLTRKSAETETKEK